MNDVITLFIEMSDATLFHGFALSWLSEILYWDLNFTDLSVILTIFIEII